MKQILRIYTKSGGCITERIERAHREEILSTLREAISKKMFFYLEGEQETLEVHASNIDYYLVGDEKILD